GVEQPVQDHAVAPQRLLPADAHARAEFRVGFDGGADAVPHGDRQRRAVPRPGDQAVNARVFYSLAFIASAAFAQDVTKVLQRDFHARGQATMDRVVQDGKLRGNGREIQRYVYGKIYNAKAYNLCSQMPRLGLSGTLTEEQIKDLVALLLDADSPVNR